MRNQVIDNSGDRRYFAMIPHLVDDAGLDPYAYRLYGHIKRIAGADHRVRRSTRQLAEHCAMSVGTVHRAKRDLVAAKLVQIHGDGRTDEIELLDIWRDNVLRYSPATAEDRSSGERTPKNRSHNERSSHERSPDEQSAAYRSHHEHERSPDEQKRSHDERSTDNRSHHEHERSPDEHIEEYIEDLEDPIEEGEERDHPPAANGPPASDLQKLAEALCWCSYGHCELDLLPERQQLTVRSEAKRIAGAGFGRDELRRWFLEHWQQTWQWRKDRDRPEPATVRAQIAVLRDPTENGNPYLVDDLDFPLDDAAEDGPPPPIEVAPEPFDTPPDPDPDPAEPDAQPTGLWSQALAEIGEIVHSDSMDALSGSELQEAGEVDGKSLYRIVRVDPEWRSYIENRMGIMIRRTLGTILGHPVLIEIVTEEQREEMAT